MRKSVVLPAPFGPSTAQCSPARTVQSTASTIVRPERRTVTPSKRTTSVGTARRAEVVDHALLAQRPARVADPPPVPDQKVREAGPVLARHDLHQVALDLDRILLLREPEPLREPAHVRVHHDALGVPALRGDDVRGLACYTGEPQQVLEAL